jgi:hypothetical protein
MASELEEKNKALVLRAFDTLFNKRDYATAQQFWSRNTVNIALTSLSVVKACSISSRAFRQR